jgi:heme/copper-type cytochrome/quinol oxidase subunit 3
MKQGFGGPGQLYELWNEGLVIGWVVLDLESVVSLILMSWYLSGKQALEASLIARLLVLRRLYWMSKAHKWRTWQTPVVENAILRFSSFRCKSIRRR